MEYNTYKEAVKEAVQKELGTGVKVSYTTIIKNNDTEKEVITIQGEDESIMPRIHIRDLYEGYESTGDFESGISEIVSIYKNRQKITDFGVSLEWEKARPHIQVRMVKRDGNEEYLESLVYQEVMNLAAVFVVETGEYMGGEAAAFVTERMMESWGADRGELYKAAVENLRNEKFTVKGMSEIIGIGEAVCGEDFLYIISNRKNQYGARAILRDDILREFADRHGRNVFILPSSVHELILLCDNAEPGAARMLKDMVSTINNDEDIMNKEEVLADSVYYYDRKTGETRIAA